MVQKEYTIEATGQYWKEVRENPPTGPITFSLHWCPNTTVAKDIATKAIAGMLRYDDGKVVHLDIEQESHSFTAIIKSSKYTKVRWDDFDIWTKEINWDSYLPH